MDKKKTITPSQRARLAASKRRAAAGGGGFKLSDGYLYFAIVAAIISVWGSLVIRGFSSPNTVYEGPVTAPRIQLSDGRHVAYHEIGAPAESAKYHVLVLHPWQGSRLTMLPLCSEELLLELNIRLVSYDRPGYGQSDPFPSRTVQSEARDIAQIADALKLGKKFHVLGISMGGYAAWGAVKYIPERLAGVSMLSPAGNVWQPTVNTDEAEASWQWLNNPDRFSLLFARYLPWALPWWMRQGLISRANWSLFGKGHTRVSESDAARVKILAAWQNTTKIPEEQALQGPEEAAFRDLKIMCHYWGFDLSELDFSEESPLDCLVSVWQGDDDWITPVTLQRYAKRVAPGIKYHELAGEGHLFWLDQKYHRPILVELLGIRAEENSAPLLDAVLKTA